MHEQMCLTCLSMLPVQDVQVHTDEAITLLCDAPFATPPNLPITWMFAKDVSCTCMYADIQKGTGHAHSCSLGVRSYRYCLTVDRCAISSMCVSMHRMQANAHSCEGCMQAVERSLVVAYSHKLACPHM